MCVNFLEHLDLVYLTACITLLTMHAITYLV